MKYHELRWSALDSGKETKIDYFCKTIDYGCAYACAPHLVQLKWTHCQTIAWEIRVRWVTVTIVCTDIKRFLIFLFLTHKPIVRPNPKMKWNNLVFSLINFIWDI